METPNTSTASPVRSNVVTFDPKYAPAFVELNREWIEYYFELEPMDLAQLERPHETILDQGGQIFFVLENDKPVGTCALIVHGDRCYELAKMAVSREAQGKGYGHLLLDATIDWAKRNGAKKITLLSNTRLVPAISLYRKHGFKAVRLGDHPDYKRCNIEMERDL